MMTTVEEPIARFTHWLRQRPNSIEFWEVVVTDERLIACFVGESYRSMLLRADMGERDRARVAETTPADLEGLAEENFAVPLEDVESIRHVEGTRFRRAKLEIAWQGDSPYGGELKLVSTSGADAQGAVVDDLAEDSRLEGVDVEHEPRRWPFR
jgi:hypothetical protein